MTVSLRLNDEDTSMVKAYAAMHGISVSELFRRSVFEHIEDELDLQAYSKAKARYDNNPVSQSLDDVAKELGL